MPLSPQDVLNAGGSGLSAVETMSDASLLPYSSAAFQYDDTQVSQVTIDGLSTYNYTSTLNTDLAFLGGGGTTNTWSSETVESRPDGSSYSVFSNAIGEPLLTIFTDSSSDHWYTAYTYGTSGSTDGLVVEEAMPSAIASAAVNADGTLP